jgi:hypothetical protein
VYLICAPAVAQVILTSRAEKYNPPEGTNAGVATVLCTMVGLSFLEHDTSIRIIKAIKISFFMPHPYSFYLDILHRMFNVYIKYNPIFLSIIFCIAPPFILIDSRGPRGEYREILLVFSPHHAGRKN